MSEKDTIIINIPELEEELAFVNIVSLYKISAVGSKQAVLDFVDSLSTVVGSHIHRTYDIVVVLVLAS
jgi:hypothetical protein